MKDSSTNTEKEDFYVISGECLSCMLPESEAPGLIGYNKKEKHCYFKRQPHTELEIEMAIAVIEVSCCGATMYRGNKKNIIKELERLNLNDQIEKHNNL